MKRKRLAPIPKTHRKKRSNYGAFFIIYNFTSKTNTWSNIFHNDLLYQYKNNFKNFTMSNKITFGGNPVTLKGNLVKVGDKAQGFTSIDGSLQPISLNSFAGKVKLLSIFPSIDTSVCSMQTRKFNEEAAKFGDKVAFIALSADLPFALKRFCGAEGIDNLMPLSDHKDMDFGNKYGFYIDELRLLARGVIIIDENDVVEYVELVPEIGNEPNYEAAIAKLNEIIK